jgi:ribosomal-protein-alanine N-acetyltransferase
MQNTLETARTQLRPFGISDAAEAFRWFSDSEVMRFIPHGPDHSVDQTSSRIARYIDHQNTHKFSKWIIIEQRSQKPIGDSGFYFLPDGKRIELGYRLSRDYWGQGFATEVAMRWLDVASEFLDAKTLFAFAHPENVASIRVMTKLGFEYVQNETFYGLNAPLYARNLNEHS